MSDSSTKTRRRSSRLDNALNKLVATGRKTEDAHEGLDLQGAYNGVSVGWLSQAFHMDPSTIKKRLADCPVLHRRKAGYIYELHRAAAYLVKPEINLEEYIKTLKASELPTHLQAQYWQAMRNRQLWEIDAGDLWRTEQVLAVLGQIFQGMKFACTLWIDTIERKKTIPPEIRKELVIMVDALQDDIYKQMQELAAEQGTKSQLADAPKPEKIKKQDIELEYAHLI